MKAFKRPKKVFLPVLVKPLPGKTTVDEEVLDNLEEALVTADVGVETTIQIIERIEKRVARDKYLNTAELNGILRDEIELLLNESGAGKSRDFELPRQETVCYFSGWC